MEKEFDPRKVNLYSKDELFEFSERGIVSLEELASFGLNEQSLDELRSRIKKFDEIKELDDWNSVKYYGKDKLNEYLSKYSTGGRFIEEVEDRLRNLRFKEELGKLEKKSRDIKQVLFHEIEMLIGHRLFGLKDIFSELLSSCNSDEGRNDIFRNLAELEQIENALKEVLEIISRNEYRVYGAPPRPDDRVTHTRMVQPQRFEALPKQSYIPQRLLNAVDIFQRNLFGRKKSLCNSAVFAPAEIAKGDDMLVQVYIYKDEETDKVVIDARMSDKDATQRSYKPLNFAIKIGDEISVKLDMHGLSIEGDDTKSVIWQNKYTKCSFFVYVPINYSKSKAKGDVYLYVNGLELGQMSFFSAIEKSTDLHRSAPVETKIYEKVFISYSHKDNETVKVIAEAYKALGTVNYFYDRHSLAPGDIFAKKIYEFIDQSDLFILCWSKNAENSDWVQKERVRAYRASICEPPKLRFYPINISPYASPPEDLKDKVHFNDYDKLIDKPHSQEGI